MDETALLPRFFPSPETMIRDADRAGITISQASALLIRKFTVILVQRSRHLNLIGPGEKHRLWSRHILESLSYSRLLQPRLPVTDIGTGNGFPGLVLGMIGYRVTMVESRRKRFLFLRYATEHLGLDQCSVVNSRIEDVEALSCQSATEQVQYTARAVAPPEKLLEQVLRISGPGSTLTMRVPGISGTDSCLEAIELECPPLDRGGFLVQYRV